MTCNTESPETSILSKTCGVRLAAQETDGGGGTPSASDRVPADLDNSLRDTGTMGVTRVRADVHSQGSDSKTDNARWSRIENASSETVLSRISQFWTTLLRKDSAEEIARHRGPLEPAHIRAVELLAKEGRFLVVTGHR
jgi:hypothetical protein